MRWSERVDGWELAAAVAASYAEETGRELAPGLLPVLAAMSPGHEPMIVACRQIAHTLSTLSAGRLDDDGQQIVSALLTVLETLGDGPLEQMADSIVGGRRRNE